jgi:hypothetical protein
MACIYSKLEINEKKFYNLKLLMEVLPTSRFIGIRRTIRTWVWFRVWFWVWFWFWFWFWSTVARADTFFDGYSWVSNEVIIRIMMSSNV